MDLDAFRRLVTLKLQGAGEVSVEMRQEYAIGVKLVTARKAALLEFGHSAQITYSGHESFMLHLDDGRFFDQESALEDPEQEIIIDYMTAFARAYVGGEGQLSVRKGLFGKTYDELDITVQGKRFRVKTGPLWGSWIELKAT